MLKNKQISFPRTQNIGNGAWLQHLPGFDKWFVIQTLEEEIALEEDGAGVVWLI